MSAACFIWRCDTFIVAMHHRSVRFFRDWRRRHDGRLQPGARICRRRRNLRVRGRICRGGSGCRGDLLSGSPSPTTLANNRRISSVSGNGPKPGAPPGAVKSHWFSANPMKSRMAGSVVQARRSAARVNSTGTPGARNARMSVAEVIDSIGGSFARSTRVSVAGVGASGGSRTLVRGRRRRPVYVTIRLRRRGRSLRGLLLAARPAREKSFRFSHRHLALAPARAAPMLPGRPGRACA